MKKYCKFCGSPIEGFSRSTKKYCNDNCKQLAFYSRQGRNWGKTDLSGIIPSTDELPFNVKPDFTLNDKQETEAEIIQPVRIQQPVTQEKQAIETLSVKLEDEKQDSVKPQPIHKYHWVNSRFLEIIEKYRQESYAEFMLSNPRNYWAKDEAASVGWVTIRFRCLLENIIRLSNYKSIDRNTLLEISRAFNDLAASFYFRVVQNYPFASLLIELRDKFDAIAKQSQDYEVSFRLSAKRKAELIAVRFLIGNSVSKINFSQLKFGDGIREEVEEEFKKRREEEE
ncbi:hypothetical protein BH11BAC2_BH11BAC2_20340 [soil metagenome]